MHQVIQMFCVYWVTIQAWGSSSFQIPAVMQSVCLQASDQVGAKVKGFELLTHRCHSSIYEVAVIWELALNEALGIKRIFSLGYPRALLPSGGPLSREFWQLTTPLNKPVEAGFVEFRGHEEGWVLYGVGSYQRAGHGQRYEGTGKQQLAQVGPHISSVVVETLRDQSPHLQEFQTCARHFPFFHIVVCNRADLCGHNI